VWELLDGDAVVYVCGDGSRMEPDVRATLMELYRCRAAGEGSGERSAADPAAWLEALIAAGRYHLDVWAGT
jgi:cytochrome P450/NADPH-cytochrome P450 reductase